MADNLRQRKAAAAADDEPAAASAADDKLDKVKTSKAAPEPDWLTRHERYVPFVLFLVAAFTRFYRLDKPAGACGAARDTREGDDETLATHDDHTPSTHPPHRRPRPRRRRRV
jgi:hypothetical protein